MKKWNKDKGLAGVGIPYKIREIRLLFYAALMLFRCHVPFMIVKQDLRQLVQVTYLANKDEMT